MATRHRVSVSNIDIAALASSPLAARELYGNNMQMMRGIYTTMRDAAVKRVSRLQKAGYTASMHDIPKLADITSSAQLGTATRQLAIFLSSSQSTVTGRHQAEAKSVKTFQQRGYKFVTKKNVRQFGEFMEDVRHYIGSRRYDSERVVNLYDSAVRHGIDPDTLKDDFDKWMDEQNNAVELLSRSKTGTVKSSKDFLSSLDKNRKKFRS